MKSSISMLLAVIAIVASWNGAIAGGGDSTTTYIAQNQQAQKYWDYQRKIYGAYESEKNDNDGIVTAVIVLVVILAIALVVILLVGILYATEHKDKHSRSNSRNNSSVHRTVHLKHDSVTTISRSFDSAAHGSVVTSFTPSTDVQQDNEDNTKDKQHSQGRRYRLSGYSMLSLASVHPQQAVHTLDDGLEDSSFIEEEENILHPASNENDESESDQTGEEEE